MTSKANAKTIGYLTATGWKRVSRLPAMAAISAALLLNACAISKPYVTMGTDVPASPSFEEAASFARGKADEINAKLFEVEDYDFYSGAFLFGTGLVGLGAAAFGAHADYIIAAGLAGSAAYGARSFLPIQDRKIAYATGAVAIECAITAIGLGMPESADSKKSDPKTNGGATPSGAMSNPLSRALGDLRNLTGSSDVLKSTGPTPNSESRPKSFSTRAMTAQLQQLTAKSRNPSIMMSSAVAMSEKRKLDKAVISMERDGQNLARTMESALDTRGPRLVAATAAIVSATNMQIVRARVNPDEALNALRTQSSAFTKSLKDAAKATVETAEDTSEQGESTSEASADLAKFANVSAGMTKGVAAKRNLSSMQKVAAENSENANGESDRADQVANIANYILGIVNLSSSCLSGTSGS